SGLREREVDDLVRADDVDGAAGPEEEVEVWRNEVFRVVEDARGNERAGIAVGADEDEAFVAGAQYGAVREALAAGRTEDGRRFRRAALARDDDAVLVHQVHRVDDLAAFFGDERNEDVRIVEDRGPVDEASFDRRQHDLTKRSLLRIEDERNRDGAGAIECEA